jgi:hypothetical protein
MTASLADCIYTEPPPEAKAVTISPLNVFRGFLLGESLAVLMDDGSQVNLVNQAVVDKLQLPTRSVSMKLGWFGKERQEINRVCCDIDIYIGNGRFQLKDALVAPLENYDVIFGAGFRDVYEAQVYHGPEGRTFNFVDEDKNCVQLQPGRHKSRRPEAVADVKTCSFEEAEYLRKSGSVAFLLLVHPMDTMCNSMTIPETGPASKPKTLI